MSQKSMDRTEKEKKLIFFSLGMIIILCASIGYMTRKGEIVLTLGVFSGNNWNVPDSFSYQMIDEAIEKFESSHKGVKVEYTSGVLREDYSEWLSSAIVKGKAPDVFFVLPEDFGVLSSVGALKKLDSLIERDSKFHSEEFYSSAYEYGRFEGVQYGLPFESVPNMMFVNKTLLSENGIEVPKEEWTWKQFYEICRQVTKDTDGNGVLDQFGSYNYTWKEAFLTNDVEVFDKMGTSCQLNNTRVEQAVQFLESLYHLNENYQVTARDFDLGKVAFRPVLLSEYRTYKPYPWSIKKYSNFDWDCITLPKGPQGDNKSELQTVLMGINVRTTQTELAWELLKTFTYDEEIQMKIFKYQVGSSVLKDVTRSSKAMRWMNADAPLGSQVNVEMISDIMENSRPEISLPRIDELEDKLDDGIRKIVQEEQNKDVSLVILQRMMNEELNKR